MKWKGLDINPRIITEHAEGKGITGTVASVQEMTTEGGVRYLLPRIEAIHAGRTRNNTRYLADKLKGHQELQSGVFSWTVPYPKPIIHNHDIETPATGRVHSAAFSEFTSAGRPGIIVVPKISEPKAIQDILDGRLLTVSIGATTDSAVCSICGTDIINEGFCGHHKGEVYDGETAEWICGNLWFDELSWVNVPADQDAMIVDMGQTFQPVASNNQESIVVSESTSGTGQTTEKERNDKDMDELQKQLEAMQAERDALKAQVEALEGEKATLEEANQALTAEKETLSQEVTEAKAEVEAEKAKVEEKETALTESATELEGVKAELATVTEAREQLVEANTALATEVRESKVSHLVDLRVALGKESSKEDALEKFKERSVESLNDSISDLEGEVAQPAAPRVVEHVQKPTPQATTVTESTKLTTEEMFKKLFGGV